MDYLKKYKNFNKIFENKQTDEEIHELCKKYNIINYEIHDDMSISVNGDVSFYKQGLSHLPLRFKKVSGFFDMAYNPIKTLKGCPIEIGGDFSCSYTKIKSFDHAPKKVGGILCKGNDIKSTNNIPYVERNIIISENKLESLDGIQEIINGNFYCGHNELKSLEPVIEVKGHLMADRNKLSDFYSIPKVPINKKIWLNNNKFEFIYSAFDMEENPSLIEDFNELDIIQGNKIILDRLKEFIIMNKEQLKANVFSDFGLSKSEYNDKINRLLDVDSDFIKNIQHFSNGYYEIVDNIF